MSRVEFRAITIVENLEVLDTWNLRSLGEQALPYGLKKIEIFIACTFYVPSPGMQDYQETDNL